MNSYHTIPDYKPRKGPVGGLSKADKTGSEAARESVRAARAAWRVEHASERPHRPVCVVVRNGGVYSGWRIEGWRPDTPPELDARGVSVQRQEWLAGLTAWGVWERFDKQAAQELKAWRDHHGPYTSLPRPRHTQWAPKPWAPGLEVLP